MRATGNPGIPLACLADDTMTILARRQFASLTARNRTERAVYRPGDGAPRTITVIVDRESREPLGHARVPALTITAMHDPWLGMVPSAVNLDRDRIELAERIGGAPVARAIVSIVNQDEDFVTLQLR